MTVFSCLTHFKIGTHIFLKTTVSPNFVIYLIKKNIYVKVLKEAVGVKDDAEGAEYEDLEEANIGKMDILFETESETSDKESDNYKCVFCPKMYIDNTELIKHVELCDVEENKESE